MPSVPAAGSPGSCSPGGSFPAPRHSSLGDLSFNIVRLLLGVAEAGFFPGIIFFLTLWFPTAYRARIVGWFMFAIPISTVIGAPISGLILGLEGIAGLHGWQWMFLIEAFSGIDHDLCGSLLPHGPTG